MGYRMLDEFRVRTYRQKAQGMGTGIHLLGFIPRGCGGLCSKYVHQISRNTNEGWQPQSYAESFWRHQYGIHI